MSLDPALTLGLLAKKLGLTIEVNDYDNFQVSGPEKAIVEFGAGSNQIEGGPSLSLIHI